MNTPALAFPPPLQRPETSPRVIAVRAALAARKRERAARVNVDDAVEPDDRAERASVVADPSRQASAHERRELVRDLLAELPDEQAEALALRVGLGCSIEEVAAETGVSVNTVKSRIRLAKERLRARMKADPRMREAFDRSE